MPIPPGGVPKPPEPCWSATKPPRPRVSCAHILPHRQARIRWCSASMGPWCRLSAVSGEVRTLAVGQVQPPRMTPEGPLIQTTQLSYFSRLTDSTTFAELAVLEFHRRGIETAGRVGAVVDGAEWCQSFIDYQYADAVRILDLPHAAEHITLFGQIATPEGPL